MFITNEETHRSVKSVTRHFSRLGWRVTETGRNNESLLQAAKRDILLFIKCVDTDIQRFLPVYEFIERIESFGRECRSRSGEGIVFVVNRPLNGLAAEALLSKGIALFALTDLDVLTNLELLYQHIPASLSVNERLIVRGCKSFCIAMSEAALKKDEISEARTWLELNLDGVQGFLEPHLRLVDVLMLEENYDAARALAVRGLSASPYSHNLLQKLRNIEVVTSNTDALTELDGRIAIASQVQPAGLGSILAKQKLGAAAVAEAEKLPQREHFGTSLFKRFLKRADRPT